MQNSPTPQKKLTKRKTNHSPLVPEKYQKSLSTVEKIREIFIQKSLSTRGRLEDIKILGGMSLIHYLRKKTRGGGNLEVTIQVITAERHYCR